MRAGFRRIAKATNHEVTAEDLQQGAWIIANEIAKRRGRAIDFSNPEDQNLVMSAVNLQNVKRGDWKMRRTIRIDKAADDDDGTINWADRLPARASSDPLVSLLLRESALDTEEKLASSYSQAVAYVMVFVHFKNNRQEGCTYLVLSDGALARRLSAAADTVRAQPSLFDRIETDRQRPHPSTWTAVCR